jgi:hypothetical protein
MSFEKQIKSSAFSHNSILTTHISKPTTIDVIERAEPCLKLNLYFP